MRAMTYYTSGLLTVGFLLGGAGLAAAQTQNPNMGTNPPSATAPSSGMPAPSAAPVPNSATKDPIGGGNVGGSAGMGPTGTHDMNSKKANKNKMGKNKSENLGEVRPNPPPKENP
ncbi:MAG: hypothetical protein AB7M05_10820 [Alphaproteobacteria bacterium]